MVREMRPRKNPKTGPAGKELDTSIPASPTKSSRKDSQASHQTPDPPAETIILAKSPRTPPFIQSSLPTAKPKDVTTNTHHDRQHTTGMPPDPNKMAVSRSGTNGGILTITGLPESFLKSLKEKHEAPAPVKSKRGRKRKHPLPEESQNENAPPSKRLRGETAEEPPQEPSQNLPGHGRHNLKAQTKVHATEEMEKDDTNSYDTEAEGHAEAEQGPAATTEDHEQANAGSPSPTRPRLPTRKEKVDLAKVVLPGPYIEREDPRNEADLDKASLIYHKKYAPLPSIKSFTDIWNGHDLSKVPTEILYKLAEDTQKALTTWQDEYIKLDKYTAENFDPPKKPATGGRVPLGREAWQQEKETVWFGCPAGIEGVIAKGDKKWRKDNAARLAGAVDGTMTGSFNVDGKRLRRRTGEVTGLLASAKTDSETAEKRTRKPAKKFDQGTNADATTTVRKKRGRPPASSKVTQTTEKAKAPPEPGVDGAAEAEDTDANVNEALPRKRGRPTHAPASVAPAADTNGMKPKPVGRKPRAKLQKAQPAPPAPDPGGAPPTGTSSYPPHPAAAGPGYHPEAPFVPLFQQEQQPYQHQYPQQHQHPPHHGLHSYMQQPPGPTPPTPAASVGGYTHQPQSQQRGYGHPPGPRFYNPGYTDVPPPFPSPRLPFNGSHQQQQRR
ncbi:MAG: hypothetical protein M1831_006560 [Alyxoria varia]|nr:MAG: hypothetical protein M1831_006560 [Alyxoria varia]